MTEEPLVSIVIPTYNQNEVFLRECIESAINQTYQRVEILISDNHSDNGASEIIAEYAAKDNRIKVIKPKSFLSLMDNFSFAYAKVSGEYICPLSSDDILYPKIVETLLTPFKKYPGLSFSYSMPNSFTGTLKKDEWKPRRFKTGYYSASVFLKHYATSEHGMFWGGIVFKTADFVRIGGFSNEINFLADHDCTIKLILSGSGVYYVNEPLSAIRRWDREEQTNRTPFGLMDCGKIYNYLENAVTVNSQVLTPALVKKIRRNLFWQEVFPIPYLLYSKKHKEETINKTIDVIKENYPNDVKFNFVLNNRNNILGLGISIFYLATKKFNSILKKASIL